MNRAVKRLLSFASEPICTFNPDAVQSGMFSCRLSHGLLKMLKAKNGFYAFESALHVYPLSSKLESIDLEAWNSALLWKDHYGSMADGCIFFAEDVFGGQFCIRGDYICSFDPETGSLEVLSNSINDWAEMILSDYEVLTGFPLAHEWQLVNGALPPGFRLVPKIPFACGGDFALDNLYLIDAVKAMRLRGDLAVQIRDLPDGANIRFEVVE